MRGEGCYLKNGTKLRGDGSSNSLCYIREPLAAWLLCPTGQDACKKEPYSFTLNVVMISGRITYEKGIYQM
jgi:hypothetical protein